MAPLHAPEHKLRIDVSILMNPPNWNNPLAALNKNYCLRGTQRKFGNFRWADKPQDPFKYFPCNFYITQRDT
jgi:hypothetical protein